MTSTLKSDIFKLLTPVLESEGIEFVDVELVGRGKRQTLRLLIHKPGGVTVRDCQHVSRVVFPILEVHRPIIGDFNLEVASPGLDRPLVTEADFRRNIGQKIQVEAFSPTRKRLRLTGTLKDVEAGKVFLDQPSGETIQVEISTITKAQIQLMW